MTLERAGTCALRAVGGTWTSKAGQGRYYWIIDIM